MPQDERLIELVNDFAETINWDVYNGEFNTDELAEAIYETIVNMKNKKAD